jgi:hypothetical protein
LLCLIVFCFWSSFENYALKRGVTQRIKKQFGVKLVAGPQFFRDSRAFGKIVGAKARVWATYAGLRPDGGVKRCGQTVGQTVGS